MLSPTEFWDRVTASKVISSPDVARLRRENADRPVEIVSQDLQKSGIFTPFQISVLCSDNGPPVLKIGRYVLSDQIGAGGMGVVYRATHELLDRVVALKVIEGSNPRFGVRVKQEMQAFAQLDHPHIVRAYDAGTLGGLCYIAMEFVHGNDLEAIVCRRGPLPVGEAIEYILQSARGLRCIHGNGILHRDVKPSNILVSDNGLAKVSDLGLAKLRASEDTTRAVTEAGELVGTFSYMSPEQALDVTSVDERTDIYSLGCTFCYLLTGNPPYSAKTPVGLIVAHREQPIPAISTSRNDASPKVDVVVNRMMAKNPADRYPNCQVLVEDLVALKAQLSNPHPWPLIDYAAAERTRRNSSTSWKKTWITAGALAAIIMGGLVCYLAIFWLASVGEDPAPQYRDTSSIRTTGDNSIPLALGRSSEAGNT
jgi:serine/threonine protein kinase